MNSTPQQIYNKPHYSHKNKNSGETEEAEMITHFRSNKNEPLPIELVCI
jgi:hypothetical protein